MVGKAADRDKIRQRACRRDSTRSNNSEVGLVGEKLPCIHGHLLGQQGHALVVHRDAQFSGSHLGLGADHGKGLVLIKGEKDLDRDTIDMGDRLVIEQFGQFGQAEHAITAGSSCEGDYFTTALANKAS